MPQRFTKNSKQTCWFPIWWRAGKPLTSRGGPCHSWSWWWLPPAHWSIPAAPAADWPTCWSCGACPVRWWILAQTGGWCSCQLLRTPLCKQKQLVDKSVYSLWSAALYKPNFIKNLDRRQLVFKLQLYKQSLTQAPITSKYLFKSTQ